MNRQRNERVLFFILVLLCPSVGIIMPQQKSPALKTFTVIYGSGGGITGMANGFIIYGNGNVEKWSGLYFRRSKIEKLGAAAPQTLPPIQKVFETRTYKKWKQQDTGNMTTRVRCISGKDTTMVSWKGMEPGGEVPPAIRDFYLKLKNVVQSTKKS